MNLDETQRKKVAEWIAEGLKLAEIQNRLLSELGARLTYMEVRLLVDDLKLTPKDPEVVKPTQSALSPAAPGPSPAASKLVGTSAGATPEAKAAPGRISMSVDQLTRAGAVVSGKVTFSDGNLADWYIDETGSLVLVAEQAGYRP